MNAKSSLKRNCQMILFFVIAAAFPLVFTNSYFKQLGTIVLLYAFYASAWNILGGYAGQLSLGHGAYIGLGAYITTVLFSEFYISPWLGMVISGLMVGLFAVAIGYPCFKLSGVYYSLSTIALVNVMRLFFIAEDTIFGFKTGSSLGYKIEWRGTLIDMQFLDKKYYFWLILLLLAVVVFVSHRIKNSKTGYYLSAISTNQYAASSLGINTTYYKLKALFISAFFAAVGGSFYAMFIQYIDPASVFNYDTSVEMTVLAMVGGRSTVVGPIIGSLLLVPLKEIARSNLGASFAGLPLIIYGVILMLVVYFLPNGILPLFKHWYSIILRRRREDLSV
jgi:branched-chain amino acid transport system permease protein